MLELLLPVGLVVGAFWWLTKDSDSSSSGGADGWKPVVNPTPIDGTLLDKYAQMSGPISVRFVLGNGPVAVYAYGSIVDVKVTHDESAGPTGTRVWLVSFDSFDPASLAGVDLKKVPGGKIPNPPVKGTKFTLTDKNFA